MKVHYQDEMVLKRLREKEPELFQYPTCGRHGVMELTEKGYKLLWDKLHEREQSLNTKDR